MPKINIQTRKKEKEPNYDRIFRYGSLERNLADDLPQPQAQHHDGAGCLLGIFMLIVLLGAGTGLGRMFRAQLGGTATNDLTQMTFGFSRDDAGKFLDAYYDAKIYEFDPFAKLDQTGVGALVKMAAEKGRATRPDIKLGICGEHGGDPSSVEFCHNIGLNYVSCSPFRVPIARLAAAQAAIKEKRAK